MRVLCVGVCRSVYGADPRATLFPYTTLFRSDILNHIDGYRAGEIVREGFRVVLAGRPNAGKSSLLNVLAKRDVAIVTDIPGTTRSEEHTSELQSREKLVCRLLLEQKKTSHAA